MIRMLRKQCGEVGLSWCGHVHVGSELGGRLGGTWLLLQELGLESDLARDSSGAGEVAAMALRTVRLTGVVERWRGGEREGRRGVQQGQPGHGTERRCAE